MASLTKWTWVWVNSRSWWLIRRPGMLWFMGSQRVGHDWATELTHITCGEQCLLGKRGSLLKILKCIMPSPDLWSSGVWGLVQTWARRTVSVFWSLSIPHASERWFEGSIMSVCEWLLFPVPGCLRPAGLVACILVSDSWSDPKGCEVYIKPHFPIAEGIVGACSASSSDSHIVSLKKK